MFHETQLSSPLCVLFSNIFYCYCSSSNVIALFVHLHTKCTQRMSSNLSCQKKTMAEDWSDGFEWQPRKYEMQITRRREAFCVAANEMKFCVEQTFHIRKFDDVVVFMWVQIVYIEIVGQKILLERRDEFRPNRAKPRKGESRTDDRTRDSNFLVSFFLRSEHPLNSTHH